MSDEIAFSEIIHAPQRLRICAFLASVDAVDFALLGETLGLSDSALSKHIKVLAGASYLMIRKTREQGRSRTWLSLTRLGRTSYEHHIHALRQLLSL